MWLYAEHVGGEGDGGPSYSWQVSAGMTPLTRHLAGRPVDRLVASVIPGTNCYSFTYCTEVVQVRNTSVCACTRVTVNARLVTRMNNLYSETYLYSHTTHKHLVHLHTYHKAYEHLSVQTLVVMQHMWNANFNPNYTWNHRKNVSLYKNRSCKEGNTSRFMDVSPLWRFAPWTVRHQDDSHPRRFATRTVRPLDDSPPGRFAHMRWTIRPQTV